MLITREIVMEMLGHFPNCTKTAGVHVVLCRTQGWTTHTIVILVCCECDAYKRLDGSVELQRLLVDRIERVVEETRLRQLPFGQQPACSGCGGQRHIGWCAA